MSIRSAFGRELQKQFKVQKKMVADEATERMATVLPPIFIHMPRPEQDKPVLKTSGGDAITQLGCPEGFFGIDHPNTSWLVNLLKDKSEWRLQKSLLSIRTRPLFDTTRYYQMIDRPTYYWGDRARLDPPLFKQHAMLFLNAFGVALYLMSETGCYLLGCAKDGSRHLVGSVTPQFASFVHDRSSDMVIFYYDFMCMKREYYAGLQHLSACGWSPVSPSLFTYRRKYYQYTVPFSDWLDIARFLLKRRPSMNLAALVEKMFALEYVVDPSYCFSMHSMKMVGKYMMEPFELREKTRANYSNSLQFGEYIGRKVLRNKEVAVPEENKVMFEKTDGTTSPARPVVPNVMSYVRRLLSFQYYFDGHNLFALPQVIRAVMRIKKNGFFSVPQLVKNSKEAQVSRTYITYLDPIIFQIDFFLKLKSDGTLLRQKQWIESASAEESGFTEEERGWYYRFDTINCVSLLCGLLQNCLIKNVSQIIVENICDTIVHVLVDSELIEPFFRYSYYDTFFGLTSVINCVPNLMSKTIMRLLRKGPITLTTNYELPQLKRMFTIDFWVDKQNTEEKYVVPDSMLAMTDFLVKKRRRMSMKIEGPATGEAMSGASSKGASGNLTHFVRNYPDMEEISPDDEALEQQATESTKKQDDERRHVKEYQAIETEFRYSSVFPTYFEASDKVEVVFDEMKTYDMNLKDCRYTNTMLSLQH